MRRKWCKFMITVCCAVLLSGCKYREKMSEEEIENMQEEVAVGFDEVTRRTVERWETGSKKENKKINDKENQETIEDKISQKVEGGIMSYKTGSEEDLKIQEQEEREAEEYKDRDYGAYVLDSHFYDMTECEFMYGLIDSGKMKMKINTAEIIEDFQNLPEFFKNSEYTKEHMMEYIVGGEDKNGNDVDVKVPFSYVLVNLSLTNLSDRDIKDVCIANFNLYKRIPDKRGLKRGLSDMATLQITDMMDYDYEHKGLGKSYYFFKLKKGETIATNVLYQVRKDDLGDNIYMVDGQTCLTTDNAKGEIVPFERINIKYLKLPLENK